MPPHAPRTLGLSLSCLLLACTAASPGPAPAEPRAPATNTSPDQPGPSAAPEVDIVVNPSEECGQDQHALASAKLTRGDESFAVPDHGFETEVCCRPFAQLDAPAGMTVYAATCEPWSCGGGCLRTTQVLFVPHDALDEAQWFELSCNENLSATAEGEANDACDALVASDEGLALELHTTQSSPCPGEAGDDGMIESASERRDRITFSASGATRSEGEAVPYKRDLWGCSP